MENSLKLVKLSSINVVNFWVFPVVTLDQLGSRSLDLSLGSLELIELSSINKVSLV